MPLSSCSSFAAAPYVDDGEQLPPRERVPHEAGVSYLQQSRPNGGPLRERHLRLRAWHFPLLFRVHPLLVHPLLCGRLQGRMSPLSPLRPLLRSVQETQLLTRLDLLHKIHIILAVKEE
uniref:Uncharacterized protein n=1 Tax=Steinernema glaseri TaxID=37863 RepID=A0A1I7YKK4_9BILA